MNKTKIVSKFINSIMYDGKRSTAEKILYDALDFIKKKNTKFTSFKKNKEVTNLNDKCWERLKSMAFETYVPESETSKSGAGY